MQMTGNHMARLVNEGSSGRGKGVASGFPCVLVMDGGVSFPFVHPLATIHHPRPLALRTYTTDEDPDEGRTRRGRKGTAKD